MTVRGRNDAARSVLRIAIEMDLAEDGVVAIDEPAWATVQRLLDLLPPASGGATSASITTSLGLGPILAIVSVLFLFVQAVFRNSGGSED